ncbi:RibD C-terminal domain-containing protein [Nocardioides sp. YR527]|uniref:hypothetical protein n=1 Tax=Nocardioides sp. YR527 TaxID=1881028 RepID=UPI0008921F2E|nr:hypothetical protein [Nocardioides sp. YR527]SDL22184.1 RibD C-terminal domain-containing protein [Nocardioides sp. YR527]
MPKYLASTTLTETTWNAEVRPGDAVEAGLLDELHVSLSPFVAGSGESLLTGLGATAMDLQNVTDLGNGAVVLTYALIR